MSATRTLDEVVGEFIEFNETGTPPSALFTDDVFVDFTMPHWRLQAGDRDGLVALRRSGHPGASSVPDYRVDPTENGFVIEWTERWTDAQGRDWYCREMARAELRDGSISEISVYCTGDWDTERVAEHRATVTLLRP
jgi:hypothetical protein